jgi:hypothetical protein
MSISSAPIRVAQARLGSGCAEQLNEVLKVSHWRLRCDVEAVVATDHHTDAALAHLLVVLTVAANDR